MKRTCTFCGPQLPGAMLTCPGCGLWLPMAAPGTSCHIAEEDSATPAGGGSGGALVAEPASAEEDAPAPLESRGAAELRAIPVHSTSATPSAAPVDHTQEPLHSAPPPGPITHSHNGAPHAEPMAPLAALQPLMPMPHQRHRALEAHAPINPVQRLQGRLLHGAFGALLLGLFFATWSGARSWELLPVLQGASFVRQLLLLVGGVTFLSTALLPVPPLFRGVIGLLMGVFGLSLGGVMLSPWQNLMAALVVLLLPAALILVSWHSRGAPGLPSLRMQRALGILGGIALLSLYLVPREGVPPLKVAIELLRFNQDDAARFLGTYLLLPLPLLGFSLVALLSEDVAILGELLAWLLCAYGPGALLILLIDNTQAYVAAAVLGYSLCGAYGLVAVLQRLSAGGERDSLR